ncbi:hypothetical protein Pcinc_034888 [Petrolisthes cinctipes]|uniref:Uncharacterized protein n=1 Tax=Petrolisthes cinctipes TaxID=88211 RepID=A0AAE1BXM5_PETCI|nr:hypothetical protein Pcinc_034888 [Petrolisthes cinctipes]
MKEGMLRWCHYSLVLMTVFTILVLASYLTHRHRRLLNTQVGLSETERDGKRMTVWEELAHLTSGMNQFEKHSQRTGEELKLLHAIARAAQARQDQDKIVRSMCGLFMPCKKPITSGSRDLGSLGGGGGGLLSPVPTMARLIP